jgi:hypothetical protein
VQPVNSELSRVAKVFPLAKQPSALVEMELHKQLSGLSRCAQLLEWYHTPPSSPSLLAVVSVLSFFPLVFLLLKDLVGGERKTVA